MADEKVFQPGPLRSTATSNDYLPPTGKLFAVTLDGQIMAFGSGPRSDRLIVPPTVDPAAGASASNSAKFLKQTRAHDGYCLWYGIDDIDLLESVLTESELHILAVDPNQEKVEQLRRRFDAAGLYGNRITIQQGSPATFKFPPYIANLVHVSPALSSHLTTATLESLYSSVRPYGGALSLDPSVLKLIDEADLKRAEIVENQSSLVVFRSGSLPESADWTHQYGDIANLGEIRRQPPQTSAWRSLVRWQFKYGRSPPPWSRTARTSHRRTHVHRGNRLP